MDMRIHLYLVMYVLNVHNIIDYVVFAQHKVSDTGKDISWLEDDVFLVNDSLCEQEFYLSQRRRKQVVFLYDGVTLKKQCVLHIQRRDRSSKTCVEIKNMLSRKNNSECLNFLSLYFGDNAIKTASQYSTCSDSHRKTCDLFSSTGAIFHPSGNRNFKFQIKFSVAEPFSKRSSYDSWTSWDDLSSWSSWDKWSSWNDRSSWSSWDKWSSWNDWSSWSSDYENEQEKTPENKLKTALIVVFVVVAIFAFAFYLCCNCTGNQEDEHERQPMTSLSQQRTNTDVASFVTSRETISTDHTNVRPARSTSNFETYTAPSPASSPYTEDNPETSTSRMPSAPEADTPRNSALDAPPPSYASLFPDH